MTSVSEARSTPVAPALSPPLRLEYLDGLRGLASLYVVVLHVWLLIFPGRPTGRARLIYDLTRLAGLGQIAVAVFIVLSGYCLMLPVVRSADGSLKGGAGAYLLRRAWRILPPYYAAMALMLLLSCALPGWVAKSTWWMTMTPVTTPGVVVSHLLLFQNLSTDWVYKISVPFWSVATEWQIYFFLPALLLPIWRRLGMPVVIAIAFLLGILPLLSGHFELAAPWFLGLFAIGMAAAEWSFPRGSLSVVLHRNVPWGTLAAVSFLLVFIEGQFQLVQHAALRFGLVHHLFERQWRYGFALDTLTGIATASLLIFCTGRSALATRRRAVLRFFESWPLSILGRFSYSLYLTHATVIVLIDAASGWLKLSFWPRAALLTMAIPIAIVAAYGFHLVFERPFMRTPK